MLIAGINISKDNAQFIVRLLIGLFGNNHGIINASVNNLSTSTKPGTSQKSPKNGKQNRGHDRVTLHQQNGQIYVRLRLQPGYNPKARHLPIYRNPITP